MAVKESKEPQPKSEVEAKAEENPAPVAPFGEFFEPLTTLRRNIDRMFEHYGRAMPSLLETDPFRHLGAAFEIGAGDMTPRVEVSETDKAYEISAELPGVDEKDVTLTLKNGMLTLSGEKKSEREEKKRGYHLSERRYGSFRRSFRVPDDVNADKIGAKFDKGVMSVTLPKSAKAKPKGRSIPIK